MAVCHVVVMLYPPLKSDRPNPGWVLMVDLLSKPHSRFNRGRLHVHVSNDSPQNENRNAGFFLLQLSSRKAID